MNEIKDRLFKELVKKGYSQSQKGVKCWDAANRSLMYANEELAKKFLEFRDFPRYRKIVVDTEIALIKDNAAKFFDDGEELNFNLIDLGCGDGLKAKVFIGALGEKYNLRYCPVHINKFLIDKALQNVKEGKFNNISEYMPFIADLESLDDVVGGIRNDNYKRNIVLLFGSILASFDIHSYLFNLSQAMMPGDFLVIGNGIRAEERFSHLELYKHSIFDEWLFLLMRELGFERDEVEYDARFANGRVEGFYRIKVEKSIQHEGKKIEFKAGDEIVMSVLYKYYASELNDYCKMYFRDVEMVTDTEKEYALLFCRK